MTSTKESGSKEKILDKEEEFCSRKMVISTKDTGLTIWDQAKEEKLKKKKMSTLDIGKMIWKMDLDNWKINLVSVIRVFGSMEKKNGEGQKIEIKNSYHGNFKNG